MRWLRLPEHAKLRLGSTGTGWNTLEHAATHHNTLQHTATHCNALHHTKLHKEALTYTGERVRERERDRESERKRGTHAVDNIPTNRTRNIINQKVMCMA